MKSKVFIVSVIFFSAMIAKAEGHEPAKMDFNQMIDENHQDNAGISEALSDHYQKEAAPKIEAKEDQTSVDDFITYEVVHLKKNAVAGTEERPVIKRVYNSVED